VQVLYAAALRAQGAPGAVRAGFHTDHTLV